MRWLRGHWLDAFLVALAFAQALGLAFSGDAGEYLAAGLAAGAALVLLLRGRAPLLVSVAAFGLLAASLAVEPKSPNVQFFGLMATFAVVAAINTTRDGVIAWCAGALLIGAASVAADRGNAVGDFALTLAFCTVMWVAGWLVSRHTRRADVMALRAQTAEQAQVIALREERARIARELHDVVSHGLSVVVLQTLAARAALTDARPTEIGRHLDAVESTARDALAEMRRMLGLLQVDDLDQTQPAAPSPGLRNLPDLVERARSAGLDADDSGVNLDTIRSEGLSEGLSEGMELTVYRIVQEALTNAAKHAPGARVQITLRGGEGQVVVEVIDDGGPGGHSAVRGAGHGLVGMRERAALYHGTLHAATTSNGGFEVRVTLATEPAGTASTVPVPG